MRLIQEDFCEPNLEWKVLITAILLNRTRGDQTRPILRELLELYPNPRNLADADILSLESLIRPLGLHRKRARKLINLSRDYIESRNDLDFDVRNLSGIGKYAHESWRMFVKGDLSFVPEDKSLRDYYDRATAGQQ